MSIDWRLDHQPDTLPPAARLVQTQKNNQQIHKSLTQASCTSYTRDVYRVVLGSLSNQHSTGLSSVRNQENISNQPITISSYTPKTYDKEANPSFVCQMCANHGAFIGARHISLSESLGPKVVQHPNKKIAQSQAQARPQEQAPPEHLPW